MATRTLARYLAPLALAAVAVAVVLTVDRTLGSSSPSSTTSTRSAASVSTKTSPARTRRTPRRRYTVRAGDTLSAIAARTGVSIDVIRELNPNLDPQALTPGQKLKLRP